jgi:hypothetical protein
MNENLYQLVYYSHNSIAGSAAALEAGITDIFDVSRRNNALVDITGALMFNAGCFGQVLEGERDAVEIVFERIQRDPRHKNVHLLSFASAPARAFERWSMAFVGASVADAARYGAIAGQTGYDPSRMEGEDLFRVLRRVAIEDEGAAS